MKNILIIAICLIIILHSTANAADWVLWEKEEVHYNKGFPNSVGTKWKIIDGYGTAKECKAARVETFDIAAQMWKQVKTHSSNGPFVPLTTQSAPFVISLRTDDMTKMYSWYCLPATVDPSEK
ncbi:MAG: hypothetical protein ABSG35_01630 [Syntrophobacteraceae bacterium]|jgi:hypothetical protein